MNQDITIWDGAYPDFAAAPREGPGFDGADWVDVLAKRLEAARSAPGRPALPVYMLPAVAAMAARDGPGDGPAGGPLRILDFGGGVGATFLGLEAALEGTRALDFQIVDSPAVCTRGRQLHAGDSRIRFHDSLAEIESDGFDIVHLGSVLQYIDDWRGLLEGLAGMRPRYLLLSDVFAGPFEGFVSLQNVYGSRIPFRFVNADELVETVAAKGLGLVMRAPYAAPVLGKYGPLPMENFPPEQRLDHSSHFLFAAPRDDEPDARRDD